jgi:hypothetical protein
MALWVFDYRTYLPVFSSVLPHRGLVRAVSPKRRRTPKFSDMLASVDVRSIMHGMADQKT